MGLGAGIGAGAGAGAGTGHRSERYAGKLEIVERFKSLDMKSVRKSALTWKFHRCTLLHSVAGIN